MALERVPADIRAQGGVARMSDPKMIKEIMAAVTIPVMAKARIGHFVECQVLPMSIPSDVSKGMLRQLHRSLKPLESITSTNPRFSHRLTIRITLRSTPLQFPLSAVAGIWAKLFVA